MAILFLITNIPLFIIIAITTASASAYPESIICPTITQTTSRPFCPRPTPAFCPQPACIVLSSISNPCACPTSVPTSTLYTECPTGCHGTCGTAYETSQDCGSATIFTDPPVSLVTPAPTTTSTDGCVTITDTVACSGIATALHCVTADCIIQSTVTLNCGCSEIYHETECRTACNGGCGIDYKTLYIPCPYTGPFPTTTVTAA